MKREAQYRFVDELKKLPGAVQYDGDASVQVAFLLANGKVLRIGITDEDVAARPGLWCDNFPGLAIGNSQGELLDYLRRKPNGETVQT